MQVPVSVALQASLSQFPACLAFGSQHLLSDLCHRLARKNMMLILSWQNCCVSFFVVGFDLISMDFHPVDREFNDGFFFFFLFLSISHPNQSYSQRTQILVIFFSKLNFGQWFYLFSNVNVIFIIFPSSHTPNFGIYFCHPKWNENIFFVATIPIGGVCEC